MRYDGYGENRQRHRLSAQAVRLHPAPSRGAAEYQRQGRLTDDEKHGLGVTFVRRQTDTWQDVPLERGTIAFPIKDHEALLAASDVAAAVSRMMGERIADLHEIAIARNLIG